MTFCCFGQNASKEGFITVNVPHERCEQRCQSVELYMDDKFLYTANLMKNGDKFQQTISFSGLADGRYKAKFNGPQTSKEPLVVEIFEVNHYSISAALKVFVLGFAMFALLLVVLYRHSKQ